MSYPHSGVLKALRWAFITYATVGCAPATTTALQWDRADHKTLTERPSALESGYQTAVEQWTRRGERFERFEGKLFVQATCLSPAFESWRGAWHGVKRSLTQAEQDSVTLHLIQRSKKQLLFFVAVATQEQGFNDLRQRGSALKAHLIIGDQVFEPQWINELSSQERFSAPTDFPYLTPLYKGYWVSFPAQPTARELSLRISSLRGSVTLRWSLNSRDAQAMREPSDEGAAAMREPLR